MKRHICICILSLVITTIADNRNVDKILVDGNNKFTAKLSYEIVKSNPDKSVVLSAFSVMPPLAQLALASVGESHVELLESIGMPNNNVTKTIFSSINSKLNSSKGITIKTANKIYVAEHYHLNNEFASMTRNVFGSEVQNINFAKKKAAADEINAWVEHQTNNRIKKLISPEYLNSATRAVLVNAIYFKGTWNIPFEKESTADKIFHISEDKFIQIPTMNRRGIYRYADNRELNAQILEISYAGDELYDSSFVIILPRKVEGINELVEKFRDPIVFENAISHLEDTEVDAHIPKFKIETSTDLKEILQKINITNIFSPEKAKLVTLIKNLSDLYVEWAVQKAFIEINEEGAEAAAANSFGINELVSIDIVKPSPPVFRADRPFYFAVRTNSLTIFNGIMHGA